MTPTTDNAISPVRELFAVLMDGNWSIAHRVSASSYGEDTGEEVWSEQGSTAWLGLVGKEEASIALSRRSLDTADEVVQIKPLEWLHERSVDFAHTILGTYIVTGGRPDGKFALTGALNGRGLELFSTFEEAKVAAQTDFDQRIRSALASRPQVAGHWSDDKTYEESPGERGEAEPDFYAVHSPTGAHIGLWSVKECAYHNAEDYEDCTITPLYASPPSPAQTVTDEMIAAGKTWFDQNFNGRPDTETLVEGILTAALAQPSKEG